MNFFPGRVTRFLRRKKRVTTTHYCDYAAATPVLPAVVKQMNELQQDCFANPSAIHNSGVAARAVVEEARLQVARCLEVRPEEVLFTASGSEANNLAIIGHIDALYTAGRAYTDMHIITTAIEHPSVTEAVSYLAACGVQVSHVPVDETGRIQVAELTSLLRQETVLVSFAYANSEVGVVQPVRQLARAVAKIRSDIVIHVDGAQAPLWLPCQVSSLGVQLLSLDAGKCNGPKGVGMLVVRHGTELAPVVHGGGQERGLRAGTENTAAVAGAATALVAAQTNREERVAAARKSAHALKAALTKHIPDIIFNGPDSGVDSPTRNQLPNNVHISLPGYDTEYAVVYLDKHGIAASTKSACSGAGGGMSSVIYAMSNDEARASSTIRFSLDPELLPRDMSYIAKTLADFVALQKQLR